MYKENDKLGKIFENEDFILENEFTFIIWLRHFGCRFYQEAKLLLPYLNETLKENNITLTCVVQGDEKEIEMFWPFDNIKVIGDPNKITYKKIGLERTNLFKILFPSKKLKERRKEVTEMGCSLNKDGMKSQSSDILQLPGALLIDKNKKIYYIHRGERTDDLDLSNKMIDKILYIKNLNLNLKKE